MYDLLTGAMAMASIVIGLFFLRFWRSTRDRFFLYFALSFLIEGAHRVYISMSLMWREDTPHHYLIRLLAYGLILWAILDKNWPRKRAESAVESPGDRQSGAQ
jgi:hypothetical protein